MKVIFLDCDGVLNKFSDNDVIRELDYFVLNRVLVNRLKTIIKDTNCYLVLSSSWRNVEGGKEFLEREGLSFIGITDNGPGIRGNQIDRYLKNNPGITDYAILDDDGDMLDNQRLSFFQTDPEYGLTDTLVYRVTYRLDNGERKDGKL